jgi:hypothetical protein
MLALLQALMSLVAGLRFAVGRPPPEHPGVARPLSPSATVVAGRLNPEAHEGTRSEP